MVKTYPRPSVLESGLSTGSPGLTGGTRFGVKVAKPAGCIYDAGLPTMLQSSGYLSAI